MNERASKDSGPYTSVYKPRSMPCGGFCGEIKGGILLALCRIKLGCPLVNAALGGPPRECSAELRTRIVLLRFYYPLFYPSTPRLYRPLYRPRLYRHLFPFLPPSLSLLFFARVAAYASTTPTPAPIPIPMVGNLGWNSIRPIRILSFSSVQNNNSPRFATMRIALQTALQPNRDSNLADREQ